jgi:hypothetical protein
MITFRGDVRSRYSRYLEETRILPPFRLYYLQQISFDFFDILLFLLRFSNDYQSKIIVYILYVKVLKHLLENIR